jgi:3alpha(or 20beta)-hydroxysteroid dehydrogenase
MVLVAISTLWLEEVEMGSMDATVAIVSGGARGMGAEHVRGLVAAGARVVFGDVLDDEGAALAAEVGDAARYVHLDVTSEDDWNAAVALAESTFGPVGALVNNAGIVTWNTIEAMSLDDWRRTIDINLTGVWLGMHCVIPSMKRAGGGAIVNISSTAGLQGYGNIGAYVASKWGVRGLTKTAALELGPAGIRVNSVHPGPIRTPMTAGLADDLSLAQPIPRKGEPAEVTALVLFLLTDATYSTGHEFVIDGGAAVGSLPRPME